MADDFDVPWGLIFLPSGDALVSERNTARLKRVTATGKVTTLGEVAGVAAPTGLGEGGLLGIALAPGDPDTVFAYLTSASDNRVVRMGIGGGKVGTPKVVLDGIPTSTHHPGGKILFDADGMLLVSTGNPYGNRTWSYGHRNDAFTSPKATWSPTSSCSPAGIAIARSTAFIGALQGKCLISVELGGTGAGTPKKHFNGDHGRLRTVALAPDGAICVTTSNTDGRVTPSRNDDTILRVTL